MIKMDASFEEPFDNAQDKLRDEAIKEDEIASGWSLYLVLRLGSGQVFRQRLRRVLSNHSRTGFVEVTLTMAFHF